MSEIIKKEVEKIADLSKLSLSAKEIEHMTKDMAEILEFVKEIDKLNIENINETNFLFPKNNVFRKDELKKSMTREELLKNAKTKEQGCFTVPMVVE